MIKSAIISPCGAYRYTLTRKWDKHRRRALFVGLNPSTADAEVDDATIRRLIGFSKDLGFGGFTIVNLFAFRSTDPKNLTKAVDAIGPENDRYLNLAFERHAVIIPMWGANGGLLDRDKQVIEILRNTPVNPIRRVVCFGTTKAGHPKHPLYLRKDTELVYFNLGGGVSQ